MKKIVSILLSIMLIVSFCGCTVNANKDVSTVVLEINGKQIKKKEFDDLVKYTMLQYFAYQETDLSNDKEQQLALKNDLYDTFVERKVKEYACKKNKLKVKEKEVKKTANDAVKALKKQVKGDKKTDKAYKEALKKFGFKDEDEFKKIAYNEAKLDAYSNKLSEDFYDKHLDDKAVVNFDMLKGSGKTFKAYLFYYYYIDQTLQDYINSVDAPSTEEETKVFYDKVAQNLVGDYNIIKAGKANKDIKVTKKEVKEKSKTSAYPESVYGQKTIYDYIKNYGLSEKQYEKAKLFQARAALYKEKMQEQINKDLENPTKKELKAFYKEHQERYNTETVSAKHILVNENREDLANYIYKQVKEYGFEDVYNTYKDAKEKADKATEKKADVDAKIESAKSEKKKKKLQKQADKLQETIDKAKDLGEVSDLNAFTYSTMVEEFSKAAFGAKKGSTVGPVKTEFGYHIINVYDKADGEVQKYKEVKDTVKTDYTTINSTERTEKEIDSLTENVKYKFLEDDYPIFPYERYVENFKDKYDVKEHNRKAVR